MGALYALSERYLLGFLYERACRPGPLKATVGPLPLLAFFASWHATRFFVSWIAAIGLTELPFFVSWTATPIFRKLAEEKGGAQVLIYPLS